MNHPQLINYDALAAQVLAPNRTPVGQANRTPVGQANRTPVQQADRTPVQQASRNSLRNSEETHTQTQGVCVDFNISKEQIEYIAQKTKAPESEIHKAVEILRVSECDNMMKMLLTASFFKGRCILEPDRPKSLDPKTAAAQREDEDARRRTAYVQKQTQTFWERQRAQADGAERGRTESMQALTWYQEDLTDDQRREVSRRIIERHPLCKQNFLQGNFTPSTLAFLSLERRKIQQGETTPLEK